MVVRKLIFNGITMINGFRCDRSIRSAAIICYCRDKERERWGYRGRDDWKRKTNSQTIFEEWSLFFLAASTSRPHNYQSTVGCYQNVTSMLGSCPLCLITHSDSYMNDDVPGVRHNISRNSIIILIRTACDNNIDNYYRSMKISITCFS